jgi:uncharacterized membrane protein (UPF0127 family)
MRFWLILAMGFAVTQVAAGEFFATRNVLLNHQLFKLEIAHSRAQRRQGLMHRKSIARDGGMLFLYDRPGDYRIWMKNTLIPLTVIWLDEDARVIGTRLLQPCRQLRCPVYGVDRPSKFIVELHPDRRQDFKPGQQLPALLALD